MTILQDPRAVMASLGIAQAGDPDLERIARPLRLPAEAPLAKGLAALLLATAEQVQEHHHFANGLGIAATQLGFEHAAVAIRSREGDYLTLFNPRTVERSVERDEQYEGCLSFFDVRGLVPRPLRITVAHTGLDGVEHKSEFGPGLARLVAHELDHLEGRLYTAHLRGPVIPIADYLQIRTSWKY